MENAKDKRAALPPKSDLPIRILNWLKRRSLWIVIIETYNRFIKEWFVG
jgi:hypothetical protein